jgi:hypothetical protein
MNLGTMQSVLRDLFSRIPSYPTTTPEPEEHFSRPRQYPVTESWNVETIESFSVQEGRKTEPEHLWKTSVACVNPDSWKPYCVELTHFLDGTQRTSGIRQIRWQKQGFGTVPFFIAQTACVVLRREGRRLSTCIDVVSKRILLEAPIRFLQRNARREVADAFRSLESLGTFRDFLWVDTSYNTSADTENSADARPFEHLAGKYAPIPDEDFRRNLSDPYWLCTQSRKWTMKYRDALEQDVFDRLSERLGEPTSDHRSYRFAVRDGTLTSARGKLVRSAIGLSKSFNTRFLEPHLQTRVLALPTSYRSPVFKFQRHARGTEPDEVEYEDGPPAKSPQKHTMLSWYVQIRPNNPTAPYQGVLRVEVHPNLLPSSGRGDRWTEADSRLVSAISAAVIEEASPTSHPDPRWHNLIYPIAMCERYARARMIPHDSIRYMSWGRSEVVNE